MKTFPGNHIVAAMAIWLGILGSFAFWFELDGQRHERQLALTTANAFFQQIVVGLRWNASHGGVYVPITADTPPNQALPESLRVLTADHGMKLTRINPGFMTSQMAALSAKKGGRVRIHITSLNPIKPESKAADWEEKWLQSFQQGVKEQGDFYQDGNTTWFRYMAPLAVEPECVKCHEQQGYQEGKIKSGVSISLPYPTRAHRPLLLAGYGSVAAIGLIFILVGGSLYERKKLLFDATFNSTIPTCVTNKNYTIMMANDSYWTEFGPLPDNKKSVKCYDHRPGASCHTDNCPLTQIMRGSDKYVCEPRKEKNGVVHHFIVTAKPLFDSSGRAVGIIESFQEISERKRLEDEKVYLIEELKKSLEQVRVLSGLIPICTSCKKVRDDQGFWTQVEAYISKHSEAQFSHGICPDCVRKLYPDICDEIMAEIDGYVVSSPAEAPPGDDTAKG